MNRAVALIRDLQQEVLSRMLHTEDEVRAEEGTVVLLADEDGVRSWSTLEEPAPDDHRVAHLEREVAALVELLSPVAVAVGTTVRGVLDRHETVVIWAVERGGESMTMRMHTIPTSDGLLVPGPIGTLDVVEAGLSEQLVAALRRVW